MLVKGFSPRKSMVMEYNELVYFTGLLNLSKVLYSYGFWGYSFWPPSSLKNRTQKTVPLKNRTPKYAPKEAALKKLGVVFKKPYPKPQSVLHL